MHQERKHYVLRARIGSERFGEVLVRRGDNYSSGISSSASPQLGSFARVPVLYAANVGSKSGKEGRSAMYEGWNKRTKGWAKRDVSPQRWCVIHHAAKRTSVHTRTSSHTGCPDTIAADNWACVGKTYYGIAFWPLPSSCVHPHTHKHLLRIFAVWYYLS